MCQLSICWVKDLRLALAPSDPFGVQSGSFYLKPDFSSSHWNHTQSTQSIILEIQTYLARLTSLFLSSILP